MNGIPQGLGLHAPPAASTLPQDRRSDMPHAERQHTDATVLTLTSAAAGKSAVPQPGLAALYALLQELDADELALLPPRTAQLLAELGRHLLPASDAGSAQRLRNLVLGSGLFLEAGAGAEDEAAAEGGYRSQPLDLKSLLGQLLALMQPGRRLALRDGQLQFLSLNPGTAQCLQAYADEQRNGLRKQRFQGRLQMQVETAFLGIVRNQLHSLAQCSEKKSRWIMDLLLQHETGPLAVPLTLGYQAGSDPALWEAEFELELRHCGPLQVLIGVKNTTVSISIMAGSVATLDLLRGGKFALGQLLGRKGLALGSYSCLRGQHERLAG